MLAPPTGCIQNEFVSAVPIATFNFTEKNSLIFDVLMLDMKWHDWRKKKTGDDVNNKRGQRHYSIDSLHVTHTCHVLSATGPSHLCHEHRTDSDGSSPIKYSPPLVGKRKNNDEPQYEVWRNKGVWRLTGKRGSKMTASEEGNWRSSMTSVITGQYWNRDHLTLETDCIGCTRWTANVIFSHIFVLLTLTF